MATLGTTGSDLRPLEGSRARLVLVVEDSQDVATILASTLEDEGCRVRIARNGRDAVEMARQAAPDLITLDLGLPGKSGWDVLLELRDDRATRDIPIVAISAHAHEVDEQFLQRVTRVIAKPFYLSEVVSTVLGILGMDRPEDAE